MPEDGQRHVQHARIREPPDDALAVGAGAVFLILHAFRDVDVDAGAVPAGQFHGPVQKVVVHGEGRVQAHMALAARGQEGLGFGESLFLDRLAVAAGHFAAEQVSEAHAVQRPGDGFEAAFQMEGGGVVIDDEGDAVLGAVQTGNKRAGLDHVAVELLVHAPPDVFEDFEEVGRRLGSRRHAAREGRVDVMVSAAERGHHDAARAVQNSVVRPAFRRRRDGRVRRHAAERPFLNLDRRSRPGKRLRVDPCRVVQVQAHSVVLVCLGGGVKPRRKGGGTFLKKGFLLPSLGPPSLHLPRPLTVSNPCCRSSL